MSVTAPAVTPLVEELVPCPDPWDVARKLAHLPHLLFLDSAERHSERGRYSYVTADPSDDVSDFRRLDVGHRPATLDRLPPFQGGFAGLFSYGLGRKFERIPAPRLDEFECPDCLLLRYNWVISFDHVQGRAWLVSTGENRSDPLAQRQTARQRVRQVTSVLSQPTRPQQPYYPDYDTVPETDLTPQHCLPDIVGVTSNFSRDGYIAAVRRVVDYINAGDCYQVNLSQRLLAPLREHPLDLYGRLRKTNPAPFACYFDAGDFQIVSASPERFLQVSPGGEVVTKPIKGTRPRGRTPEEDAALVRDLINSPKDRAENVMIVDLLRNDLGRVCEYGSVRVPKVCEVETYPFVHHLVSEVRGKLRQGMTPFDLLRAAFPGGSVTGAPKVRAMEIIAELEPTARGPYCGSVGWVGFDGAMDTNILIRTFTAGRGWVQFPVGGGIVADSDPATEYEETLNKAAGLLKALQR
jgi:para-aminobenzoate synthetase component 1